ncbi:MAG: DUF2125 domain-containing protein, partial [Rhodospirillaceae bacterium]
TAEMRPALNSVPSRATLEAWQADAGTLEVDALNLEWAPLSLMASGTMALDGSLQPVGAFNARFQGFFHALDALAEQGVVRSRDASMARVVLGLLTRTPPHGGPPELSLPMTLQDGKLFAGPVELMSVPTLRWPEGVSAP